MYTDVRMPREDTTAWMQEVEQRMEQLPTSPWMGEGRATHGAVAEDVRSGIHQAVLNI